MYGGLQTGRQCKLEVGSANNIALYLYCIFIVIYPTLINGLIQSHNGTSPQKLNP